MSQITRTYTFSDGTTAYGSQVESEVSNITTTWNNHDTGTSTWTVLDGALIRSGDGLVGTPGITFKSDPDTGLYRVGANDCAVVTGGALALEFTSSDIYTVNYQDYSATSSIVGWSAFTTKTIYYKKIGKLVWIWWDIRGTSNAVTTTFTLPYTAANTVSNRCNSDTTDNGTQTTTGGEAVLPGNTATVQIYKDMSQAVWTNSGTKNVIGMMFYQTT